MQILGSRSASSRPFFRRVVLILLAFVILLAVAGFLYENISEARDRRFNPMEGQLVNVGGRKMHIDCTGTGSPVVVLDSGLGDSYLSWRKVEPEIAKFTRVCSYDRSGLGYSDSSSRARTSQVISEELHSLKLRFPVPQCRRPYPEFPHDRTEKGCKRMVAHFGIM